MQVAKPVGRNASSLKYDILSAMGIHALSKDKHRQRLVLRLMTLITTRYNWHRNELSIGRKEIAKLWSVDERTVKRELAKLRSLGWLMVKRPGARGRVTVYELDLRQLMLDTQTVWELIGTDFCDRMQPEIVPEERTNVVPFKAAAQTPAPQGDDDWSLVQKILHQRDPELWSSWFQHLYEAERAGEAVTLVAPSLFMADYITGKLIGRLLAAYGRVDPTVRAIRVKAAE